MTRSPLAALISVALLARDRGALSRVLPEPYPAQSIVRAFGRTTPAATSARSR